MIMVFLYTPKVIVPLFPYGVKVKKTRNRRLFENIFSRAFEKRRNRVKTEACASVAAVASQIAPYNDFLPFPAGKIRLEVI